MIGTVFFTSSPAQASSFSLFLCSSSSNCFLRTPSSKNGFLFFGRSHAVPVFIELETYVEALDLSMGFAGSEGAPE